MSGSGEYIFRPDISGKLQFVGDFEGLYKNDPDPWQQSGYQGDPAMNNYYSFSRTRLLQKLGAVCPKDFMGRGEEIGCGHGQVTDMLQLAFPQMYWTGSDISLEAIKQAQQNFPWLETRFFVKDIIKVQPGNMRKDVLVLCQVWWYVMDKLLDVMDYCSESLCRGGLLVISQAFLREQKYGRDICDGFEGMLVALLTAYSDRFCLIEASYDDSKTHPFHDGLVILRKI